MSDNCEYLKPIIKSLIETSDNELWLIYRNQFKDVLKHIDGLFDKYAIYTESYFNKYKCLPKKENIISLITLAGEIDLREYIDKILKNKSILIHHNKDSFILLLLDSKTKTIINKVNNFQADLVNLVTNTEQTEKGFLNLIDHISLKQNDLKRSISPDNKSTEYMLYDISGVEAFTKIYEDILYRKNNFKNLYLEMPWTSFVEVGIKPGDLFINGGYTSNGKSMLLRYLSYNYIINNKRNVLFITLEMEADGVTSMFHIMHANNKKIFPNTPKISYTKYKKGNLNKEEEDFLLNVVSPDFSKNDNYGTLKVYKPNKTKFTLSDVKNVISETQYDMPIDILSIDYLTLLHPVEGNKSPISEDYNQMIKEFKQVLLTNLDTQGNKSPLIGLTAAQISRQGYQECLKNNEMYSLSALYQYSELEKSADIVCTILRTPTQAKEKKIKLQFLKNRDGMIPYESKELLLDIEYGGNILEASAVEEIRIDDIIKQLEI